MQALLLSIHIIAMSISLMLTASALILGFLKRRSLLRAAKGAFIATITGTLSGIGLLWYSPVASLCLTLGAYLVGFLVIYRYVFGNGTAEACPFLVKQ